MIRKDPTKHLEAARTALDASYSVHAEGKDQEAAYWAAAATAQAVTGILEHLTTHRPGRQAAQATMKSLREELGFTTSTAPETKSITLEVSDILDFLRGNDPQIAEFLVEATTLHAQNAHEHATPSRDLYDAYTAWCHQKEPGDYVAYAKLVSYTFREFIHRLRAAGFPTGQASPRDGQRRTVAGITLNTTQEPEA